MDEGNIEMIAEQACDFVGLVQAHQAGIDEDARQAVADGRVQQGRDHGGIDPARYAADDALPAHLLADLRDHFFLEGRHRPAFAAAGYFQDEVFKDLPPLGRVQDFGVKLHAVKFTRFIGDGGIGAAVVFADDAKTPGKFGHAVAMAHPDLRRCTLLPDVGKERRGLCGVDGQMRPAKFAGLARHDLAAQLFAHGLKAIADAKHGNAQIENGIRRARAVFVCDRGGTAGQNNRLGIKGAEGGGIGVKGLKFRINPHFAHASCDQLRDL